MKCCALYRDAANIPVKIFIFVPLTVAGALVSLVVVMSALAGVAMAGNDSGTFVRYWTVLW